MTFQLSNKETEPRSDGVTDHRGIDSGVTGAWGMNYWQTKREQERITAAGATAKVRARGVPKGLAETTLSKGLASQAWGSGSNLKVPLWKCWMWWGVFLIPVLLSWIQEDAGTDCQAVWPSWCVLGQWNTLSRKRWPVFLRIPTMIDPPITNKHIHIYIHAHTCCVFRLYLYVEAVMV